ncbi:unnamed protein product [Caenorhabditis auriculariae]|uniref:peptide-methionine (S)-S-oxide reductase n=1 Tax=Caenorhabditis auriculariae TaxID=2777116 RepID=A0A8S1HAH5_9PELO|nr:unnamed protein product [Caenorhabditis auriculariae]
MPLHRGYFGLQCFWGESAWAKGSIVKINFNFQLKGVRITRVGYAGGTTNEPTYKKIGDHTEITEVQYDPKLISYRQLLEFFWSHHNPLERRTKQYQSAIIYENMDQKAEAMKSLDEAKKKFGNVETYIVPLDIFYQAEDYHQKYWLRNKKEILDQLSVTDGDIAQGVLCTKLNAYAAGYTDFEELELLAKDYELSPSLVQTIKEYALSGGDPRNCH